MDNTIKANQQAIPQLAGLGYGQKAQELAAHNQQLAQQRAQMGYTLMGKAAQMGDWNKVLEVGKKSGHLPPESAKVELDGDGNVVAKDADGKPLIGMNRDALEHMGYTNDELANIETKKFTATMAFQGREAAANAGVKRAEVTAQGKMDLEKFKATLPKEVVGFLEDEVKNSHITQAQADDRIKFLNTIKQNSSMALLMQMPSAGDPQEMPHDPARPWRDSPAFNEAQQKAPNLVGLIDQYMNGDLPPGGSRSTIIDKQIQAWGAKLDNNVSFRDYKLKQDAMKDPQVTAGNAALGHIGDFQKVLGRLDNATRSDVVNHSLNWLSQHAEGNENLAELYTIALSLSEEYGKALGAGQNVTGDLKREAVFNPDAPLSVILSRLHAVGSLLDKTVASKENILNRSNPRRVPLNLMDPDSLEVLQSLGIKHSPGNRGGAGGGNNAPEPAAPGGGNPQGLSAAAKAFLQKHAPQAP
jgi:hypothetical protein